MTDEKIILYIKAFLGGSCLLLMLAIISISCIVMLSVFFENRTRSFDEHMVFMLIIFVGILFAQHIYTWLIYYVNTNIQLVLLAIFIAYCVASAAAIITTIIRLFT